MTTPSPSLERLSVALNLPQYEVVTSDAETILFVAGIGTGKSTVAGYWLRDRMRIPGSVGLLVAGTYQQMKDATLKSVQKAWEQLGICEGEHYVVGVRPPKEWRVRAWHGPNSANVITFRWGSYIRIGSVERFNTLRGGEYDYIVGDEWRDWKDKAVEVLIGRLRGQTFAKLGLRRQLLLLTSPPDDPEFVQRYFNQRGTHVVRCSTYDNERFLPDGYIDKQEAVLDPLSFDREVLGKLISTAGTTAYDGYDVVASKTERVFDPTRELWTAWDFNTGLKPMSCILIQQDDQGNSYAVKEFVLINSNTEKTAKRLVEFLNEIGYGFSDGEYKKKVNVTGDMAGNSRSSNADRTNYQIIAEVLQAAGYESPERRTRRTVSIKGRVANTNWLFCSTQGVRRLFVNPETCPELHADLCAVVWDSSGMGLDDTIPKRTHPSDALSYYPYNYHRIGATEVTIGAV